MDTIRERVLNILISELDIEPDSLGDDTELAGLGLDSLSFLEMIAQFKDEFALGLSIHEISEYLRAHPIKTVGRLVRFVEEMIGNLQPGAEV